MPSISRARASAYVLLVLLVLAVGGRFLVGHDAKASGPAMTKPTRLLRAERAPLPSLVVYVVGAVRRPGLYTLPEGSRLADAVKRAGGPTAKAALAAVNFAAPLGDGQQVVVPAVAAGAGGCGSSSAAAASAVGKVRLSAATLAELDGLPGVGPVTAQKILDYRTEHGGFRSLDELDAIPGIGPARLAQLKELVEL